MSDTAKTEVIAVRFSPATVDAIDRVLAFKRAQNAHASIHRADVFREAVRVFLASQSPAAR